MSRRHERHFQGFAKVLSENVAFEKEVRKLSPFEFEVLCISSTELQLRDGLIYFAANEVTATLLLGILKDDRREEVRDKLSRTVNPRVLSVYDHVRSENVIEEDRIRDLADWITGTLNQSSIRRLVNQLDTYLIRPEEPRVTDNVQPEPPPQTFAEEDAQSLLRIIHFAGGKVPECFFNVAETYGESGETTKVDINVPEVIREPTRRDTAIAYLLSHDLLIATGPEEPSRSFMLRPDVSIRLDPIAAEWKVAALTVLCRAFPRWPHISASREQCKSLVPILQTMIPHLPMISLDGIKASLAEVCISASYFGDLQWKENVLNVAASIDTGDPILVQKLGLRTRMLHKLLGKDVSSNQSYQSLPTPVNQRCNALIGEQIVFEMKALVERGTSPEDLERMFERFQPLPSTQERQVLLWGQECIAKGMRFRGRFKEAKDKYAKLMQDYQYLRYTRNAPPDRVIASFAEISCEIGRSDIALCFLSSQERAAGPRLEIAFAHAHLTKALWHFYANSDLDQDCKDALNQAEVLYKKIQDSQSQHITGLSSSEKETYFVACAGLAIRAHILAMDLAFSYPEDSRGPSADANAFSAWARAQEAARAYCPEPGYSEMLALYSQSELAYRLCRDDAGALAETSRRIYYKTGRQYFYVAHGTVWLEILEKSVQKSGRVRMTPTIKLYTER